MSDQRIEPPKLRTAGNGAASPDPDAEARSQYLFVALRASVAWKIP